MAKRKQPNLTQYQVKTDAPPAFITAVPKFEWRQPLSTPPTQMGPKSRTAGVANITAGMFAPVFTPPVMPPMGWLTPLSEPVRTKPRLHPSLQDVSADVYSTTEVVTVDKWFDGLDVPTRAKQRAIADYAFAPLAISEVVTIDKWFNPLAPPVRTVQATKVNLFPFSGQAAAETVTVDKWFNPLADPVTREKFRTGSQQTLAFIKTPDVATDVSWYQPWSAIMRRFSIRAEG